MYHWICIILLSLTACSSEAPRNAPPKPFRERVAVDVFEAAQSPLVDVGIKRQPIPEELRAIMDKPYALPKPATCRALNDEIAELNLLLGMDVDETFLPEPTGQEKYLSEGSDMAIRAASGFTLSKVGIIPFTGVVRRISGAERHAKAVAKAYQAGKLRRAYLKGVAKAYRCSPPTKPSGDQNPSETHQ